MLARISVSALVVSACLPAATPTFSTDVAPILYNRCARCHRQGEAAPMALTSYTEARPWAKAIKAAVVQRKMPPWLSEPHTGSFANDRRLSDGDVQTIVAWADGGAPEGDPKMTPALPKFESGWNIGKADMVMDIGTDFAAPAPGGVSDQYFTVPTNFTEDRWVEAAEVRPDKRAVVHHVIAFLQEPDGRGSPLGNLLVGYAPGEQPMRLDP